MYSYEERMRAVLLYIQYDHSASATVPQETLRGIAPLQRSDDIGDKPRCV